MMGTGVSARGGGRTVTAKNVMENVLWLRIKARPQI